MAKGISTRALSTVRQFFPHIGTVRDGRRPVRINITRQDSDLSMPRNHERCAMSRACKEVLDADGIVTSRAVVYVCKRDVATRYILSHDAQRQVKAFDRGKGFAAGHYTLHAPGPGQKLGSRTNSRTGTSGVRRAQTKARKIDADVRAAPHSGKRLFI